MFLIKQQLTTSNKVNKQSSVTEVFSYNIVLGERPKILLCHQLFFFISFVGETVVDDARYYHSLRSKQSIRICKPVLSPKSTPCQLSWLLVF